MPSGELVSTQLCRRKRYAWITALTNFILFIGSPLFPLGIAGLYGLLNKESKAFFWGERKSREAVRAEAAANIAPVVPGTPLPATLLSDAPELA